MKYTLGALTFFLLLVACEEEIDYEGSILNEEDKGMVVTAWVTNERLPQTVHLNQLLGVQDVDQEAPPIEGAEVSLEVGEKTWTLSEVEPGIYRTDDSWQASPGDSLYLSISWNGENYSASTYMAKATDFEPFLAYSSEELGIEAGEDVKNWPVIPFLTNQFGYDDAARWQLRFTINIPDFPPQDTNKYEVFFTHPNLETNGLLSLESIDYKRVPDSTVMTLRKYSLSDEGYEYYRSVLTETDWSGDLYSTLPGNVPGNISNGAYGFFGASQVIHKTRILHVE